MSRGVIVTDLLTKDPILEVINQYNFNDIEPFTIILVMYESNTRLFELVWDGTTAHFNEKPLQPTIWSSSLLYTPEAKAKREKWYSEFLFNHLNPNSDEILSFHKNAGDGDSTNALIMNRGIVQTKSITQVQKHPEAVQMTYIDLQTNQQSNTSL
ncbi:MAG: hypothetical protein R3359_04105, partial [Marinirhabdus sp.]|nr:hypothetical protein [Marinirhabdus sp.]